VQRTDVHDPVAVESRTYGGQDTNTKPRKPKTRKKTSFVNPASGLRRRTCSGFKHHCPTSSKHSFTERLALASPFTRLSALACVSAPTRGHFNSNSLQTTSRSSRRNGIPCCTERS